MHIYRGENDYMMDDYECGTWHYLESHDVVRRVPSTFQQYIRQPNPCGHFLLRNLDFPIIKTASNRSVPSQNLPNTNVSKGGEAATVNTSCTYRWSTPSVGDCAGHPFDSARNTTTF